MWNVLLYCKSRTCGRDENNCTLVTLGVVYSSMFTVSRERCVIKTPCGFLTKPTSGPVVFASKACGCISRF